MQNMALIRKGVKRPLAKLGSYHKPVQLPREQLELVLVEAYWYYGMKKKITCHGVRVVKAIDNN